MASPYIEGSGTLVNKLGITDAQVLHEAEYLISSQVLREFESGRLVLVEQGFGLGRQQEIHKNLLQDVYDWAGEVRSVPSARRSADKLQTRFCEPEAIVSEWAALESRTDAFVAAVDLSFEQKCDGLASIFVDLNQIHTFLDGNGRSAQVFMSQLAREQGVELDYCKVQPQEWNQAAALSAKRGRLFEHVHFMPVPIDILPALKSGDSCCQTAMSRRENVLGCIRVPVVCRATFAANPFSYSKSCSTFRTAGGDKPAA